MTCVINASNCVVDSDDGRCSAVGQNILSAGGNAVDAAVAVTLCLGVMNAGSSGIGGGSFMLVRMADGTVQGFDMRETAPAAATAKMYEQDPSLKAVGRYSIAVPGELKGLYKAWTMFGKLEWAELVEPAIRYAKEGFSISPYLRSQMEKVEDDILKDVGLRDIYARKDANGDYILLKAGDICKNKALAATLQEIANEGADAFYSGEIATKLVNDIQDFGGNITKEDLKNYQVKLVQPLSKALKGLNMQYEERLTDRRFDKLNWLEFLTMPPPSSGGAGMVLILNILEKYYDSSTDVGHIVWFHRFIEACKHMIAVRTHLGDPNFEEIGEVLNDMVSKYFAGELKNTISDDETQKDVYSYGGKWHVEDDNSKEGDEDYVVKDHGTSHLSIVDGDRNAVALTSSVNYYFGSRFLSVHTGILLNNQMDDFTLYDDDAKSQPNSIKPNKRPLSSMAPTIILQDGNLRAVIGSSGGFRIIAGTAQVFLNHFIKGMGVLSSVKHPRIFHQLIPAKLEYEDWKTPEEYNFLLPKKVQKDLKRKGHELQSLAENNMCQFLTVNLDSTITGASDPRKGSYPAGY